MPSIISRKKKKLAASTARRSRSLGMPEAMDYEQMAEPNMKLSRALLIVLLLHIVAVAGIVAFNTIKTRENFAPAAPDPVAPASAAAAPATAASSEVANARAATTEAPPANTTANLPNEPGKAAPHTEMKATAAEEPAPSAAPAAASTVKDSGKTYTVVRGDNPVTIARRLKVSEADLLELNQITDPRKLQINQKLHIPERRPSSKSK